MYIYTISPRLSAIAKLVQKYKKKKVYKLCETINCDSYSKFPKSTWNAGVGLPIGMSSSYFGRNPLSIKIQY